MDIRAGALHKWLARLDVRSELGAADRATVLGLSGTVATFATSRDVVRLGERTTHCCLVADGLVGRFGQTADGLRQLSAFYIPGDMGDLHSAVLPHVTAPLQSALRATVVFVPHSEVVEAAARSPTLARAFWRDCVVDAQLGSEWMLNNGRRDARARVAHLMCELVRRFQMIGDTGMSFPFELSQNHLADATGLTAVHVNRTLRSLREAGAFEVRDRRGIVLDWALLARIGDFDPDYLHIERVERRAKNWNDGASPPTFV